MTNELRKWNWDKNKKPSNLAQKMIQRDTNKVIVAVDHSNITDLMEKSEYFIIWKGQ